MVAFVVFSETIPTLEPVLTGLEVVVVSRDFATSSTFSLKIASLG